MRNQRSRLLMVLLASCGLAGCGTVVPNIKEAWDSDIPVDPKNPDRAPIPGAGQIEFEIKSKIFCELKKAVQAANRYYVEEYRLPKDWLAQVSLSLEVDESSALNPGVAFNTPMANAISTFGVVTTATPQLFSLGVGGTLSSTATRTDKFDPSWTIEWLSEPTPPGPVNGVPPLCGEDPNGDPLVRAEYNPAKSSPLIESDLGLREWLLGAMWTNQSNLSVTEVRKLTAEEVADERRALNDYRLKDYRFKNDETAQIVASGAFTSSLLELVDNDPELRNLKVNAELEEQNPELYRKKLDLYNKKLKEKVKPALENKLNKLLNPGKVTPKQIALFFGSGGSLSELQGLLNGGYDKAEIADIIDAKVKAAASGGGGGSGGGGTNPKPDTLTIEIKFIIVSSANVLPTWKLVRVSSGTGSTPLFGIGRTRTHDLIITIGPQNPATAATHLASQIGVAVSNANRANLLTTTPSNTFTFPPFAF